MPDIGDAPLSAPVVIVGAGPVGLALALGLARHGVRSMLLEREAATSEHSKAPVIHLRTREVLRRWGAEQPLLEAGTLRRALRLHSAEGRGARLTLDFSALEDEAHRPGALILEQDETERLLLEMVRDTAMCDVHFGAEAVALHQHAHGARLEFTESGGRRSLEAAFVAGCDGAGSFVRSAVGLGFDGLTYSTRPMLADVRVHDHRDRLPWPRMRISSGGVTSAVRLRPEMWRIIRLETAAASADDRVTAREVRARAAEVLGSGPVELEWASRFRIHRRAAPTYRAGRVVLAGDAAHIHSPIGGLGMNAGIQDAHNLAWKLAQALDGGDVDRLLDSYDHERRAGVAGTISRYTDVLTKIFLLAPPVVREAAFAVQRLVLKVPRVRRMGLRRAGMIDLGYRASPLLADGARPAGARLPDPELRSPDGLRLRLYDLLPAGPVLLDIAEERDFAGDLPVASVIRIGPGGYREPAGMLRRLIGQRDGWILVRPDAHIAWARTSADGMDAAVRAALGMS